MSDTIEIILIIAVFIFFMYRKKFSALLSKRKTEHTPGKETADGQKASSAALSAPSPSKDIPDTSGGISEQRSPVPYRYEAYAFDYAEYPESEHFADRISAKLDVIEMAMQNKRHYIKFVGLGTCLLILVKYHDRP